MGVCHFNKNNERRGISGYSFNLRAEHTADFFMFIALDMERLLIMPAAELEGKNQLRLLPPDFTQEDELDGVSMLRSFKREDHLQKRCKQVQ